MSEIKSCVLCDIDGTIAHEAVGPDNKPLRGWYDYELVHTDIFDDIVFEMVRSVSQKYDAYIVFLTGRVNESYDVTLEWLSNALGDYGLNHMEHFVLYTRDADDTRCDTVFKKDVIENKVLSLFDNIVCAFEDRPIVVDAYHDMGIKTIAVADQRIKF